MEIEGEHCQKRSDCLQNSSSRLARERRETWGRGWRDGERAHMEMTYGPIYPFSLALSFQRDRFQIELRQHHISWRHVRNRSSSFHGWPSRIDVLVVIKGFGTNDIPMCWSRGLCFQRSLHAFDRKELWDRRELEQLLAINQRCKLVFHSCLGQTRFLHEHAPSSWIFNSRAHFSCLRIWQISDQVLTF